MARRKKDPAERPAGPGEKGWQAYKSSSTRQQILDAAVHCIVHLGYPNTTTMMIAEQAGLSRGATLHHFPSKNDIITATVEYLFEKRTRAFINATRSLPTDANRVKMAVRAYWERANHPLFLASTRNCARSWCRRRHASMRSGTPRPSRSSRNGRPSPRRSISP